MDQEQDRVKHTSENIAADEDHFNEDQHDTPDPAYRSSNKQKKESTTAPDQPPVSPVPTQPIVQEPKSLATLQLEMMQKIVDSINSMRRPISMFDDIVDFHTRFELEYKGTPRCLVNKMQAFRIQFLEEELDEYKRASVASNMEGMLDALVDLAYVVMGTAYLHGFNFPEAWKRVHEANMKKIRVPKGSGTPRGGMYDVVKPEGWQHPNLKDLVR